MVSKTYVAIDLRSFFYRTVEIAPDVIHCSITVLSTLLQMIYLRASYAAALQVKNNTYD